MSDPALPQDLHTHIRALERRIAALERSPQLVSSSIKGGAIRVLDSSGNEIGVIGQFDGSGETDAVGMRIQDSTGADLLFVTEASGFGIPVRGVPWRENPAVFQSTTSGTFTTLWSAFLPVVEANAVRATCVVTLDAADEAEVKVYVDGSTETDTVTLSGATATQWTVTLNWEHGLTRGVGPYTFQLQVRRSSGTTAAVNVYEPTVFEERNSNSVSATSGGLTAS